MTDSELMEISHQSETQILQLKNHAILFPFIDGIVLYGRIINIRSYGYYKGLNTCRIITETVQVFVKESYFLDECITEGQQIVLSGQFDGEDNCLYSAAICLPEQYGKYKDHLFPIQKRIRYVNQIIQKRNQKV